MKDNYWFCLIGPGVRDKSHHESEKIMKDAVTDAFIETTGTYAESVTTSWNVSKVKANFMRKILQTPDSLLLTYDDPDKETETLSDCCTAPIIMHDICSKCKEHI